MPPLGGGTSTGSEPRGFPARRRSVRKRAFDFVAATIGLLIAAPILAVAALATKLQGDGPIIFRQERVGAGGRSFIIFKLRTMVVGAQSLGTGLVVAPSDSRITRVGRVLRRLSIDELPQLVNVMRGEMSLVGPRPTVPAHVARYDEIQRRRLEVPPGIAGWAQVNGRNEISWPRRIELDVWYVDHWSFRLDLLILVRAVAQAARGHSTYGPGSDGRNEDFAPPAAGRGVPDQRLDAPAVSRGGRLAVDGGAPVRTRPYPRWPSFAPADLEAALTALRDGQVNYWTGQQGRRFEREFAQAVGCTHGVALANGTVALEIALRALGVGPGDEVIVPSRTFIGTASCAVTVGARPVVADVDPDSQNLTAAAAAAVLTPRTKAIIAVHLGGWPADMSALLDLARPLGIPVVEDCAQAHGATIDGEPVGSLGAVGAWSFCQDKILTTAGEGGMVTTSDETMARWAWSYKDHGKSWEAAHAAPTPGSSFRWLHESFGTNARMHELAAAVGRTALPRLPADLERRRRAAHILSERLGGHPALRTPAPPPSIGHSYYRWYTFVRPERLRAGWDRDRILAAIQAEGIPCSVGSCGEIYREGAFPDAWRPPAPLPVAARLAVTSLALTVHPTLDDTDLHDAADAVDKVLAAATAVGRP